MYIERLLEIGRAENGFVISCCVPLKSDKKVSGKNETCCENEFANKQYIAKDEKEVACVVAELMPLLSMDYKTEEDFDSAFKAATKEPHCGGK
jgi:hypothetical protein